MAAPGRLKSVNAVFFLVFLSLFVLFSFLFFFFFFFFHVQRRPLALTIVKSLPLLTNH